MENSNCSEDVKIFEDLFKDRFTEEDSTYNEIKSKALPPPAVIFPWRVKKVWNKQWDFTRQRRDGNRSRYNDRDHHRSNSYRDRSQDGEGSRDRYKDDREPSSRNRDDRNWKRDSNQHHSRNHRDRE